MPGLLSHEKLTFLLQALALSGVVVRMLSSGLNRIYRFFFVYLLARVAQLAVPLLVSRKSNLYFYLYVGTEGAIVCLYVLVLMELYSLVLHDLHGLARTARRYIQFAVGASVLLSLFLVDLGLSASNILALFFSVERSIVSSVLLFLFLITAFLVYFPVPLNRNVIYYSIGFAFYFACRAVALLIAKTGAQWDRTADLAALWGSTACLLFWVVFLNQAGERKRSVVVHPWGREGEEKVLGQLRALNASLMRARK